jgi:hypothetical protein
MIYRGPGFLSYDSTHRLNMELDLLFVWAPCVQLYSLAETPQTPPHLGSNTRALLVSIRQPKLIDNISL